MPWKPLVHRPVGWRDKVARDRDYAVHRDKPSLALMRNPAWRKARVAFLAEHRVCARCGALATIVDHTIPYRGDPGIFWDRQHWQALCASCHGHKTAAHDGGFGNRRRQGGWGS